MSIDLKMTRSWVCVPLGDEESKPTIEHVFGPFEDQREARRFADQYNAEHGEDSPERMIVRLQVRFWGHGLDQEETVIRIPSRMAFIRERRCYH